MKSLSLLSGSKTVWAAATLVTVGALALSRWRFAPRYLYSFDSVNFALALEKYDLNLHQPQPPGYPLFVGLTRLLHWFISAPERVFLIAGLLAATLAVLWVWVLGEELFDPGSGLLAAALLAANPAFWLAGITNQVRIFLAAGAVGVAWLSWHACQTASSRTWFYGAAVGLGVAAGFRPELGLLLIPLLAWAGIRSRRSWKEWAVAGALLCLTVGAWLAVTVAGTQGFGAWLQLMWRYSQEQFHSSSLPFGASAASAWDMVQKAVVWNGLGVLTWLWAVPFVLRKFSPNFVDSRAMFLATWFFPAFLFQAVIHIGDPDHALSTIPVLCLLGGAVLSRLLGRLSGSHWLYGLTAAAVLYGNAMLFFHPLGEPAIWCTYRAVKAQNWWVNATFHAIDELRRARPVTVVDYGWPVSWRHLSYYFPDELLLVLQADPLTHPDISTAWLVRYRRVQQVLDLKGGEFKLSAGETIVWLLPPNQKYRDLLALACCRKHGELFYTDTVPGMHLRLGGYRFAVSPSDSEPAPGRPEPLQRNMVRVQGR